MGSRITRSPGRYRNVCWSGTMLVVSVLILQLLVVAVVSGFEPDFLYPLENVTVAQGRDATFTCVVNNLGGYRVSGDLAKARVAWIKADTKAILAIHEHVITNNARLSVTHNDFNTWTLNIRGVRREDRGEYMCQVNTDPMKMQTAFLEVVIPPDIVYEETSGDMMVPEGGSAKLVCRARGHPKPRIVWRREDGAAIVSRIAGSVSAAAAAAAAQQSNGGTSGGGGRLVTERLIAVEAEMLTLSKVTRSEMGAYLCIAANGVPPSVSKRMMLHVHFHPLIQVPNQLVGAPINTDVTLQCHVEASPKAINYWTRESGDMIISNDKYHMSEINNSIYSVQMRLVIRRFHKADLGGYKCISKNSIGDAEGNIRLYEMEMQERFESPNLPQPYDHDEDAEDTVFESPPRRNGNGAGTSAGGDDQHQHQHTLSKNSFQGSLTEPVNTSVNPDSNRSTAPAISCLPPALYMLVMISNFVH